LYESVDRFVVVSEAHAARLYELGLPAGRSATLPNFVPAGSFAAESRAHEGRYALVAGRLVEEKGFDTAIAAARLAAVPLIIAGEGPDESRLRKLAEGSNVRFTGRLAPQALADVRLGAAVVLVPSRCEEACPYSVLDACAAGVPVLGSDRGGIPELLGDHGALPAEAPRAWARALSELWRDAAARRERGQRALERAGQEFSEHRYHQRLAELYSSL
jgi:glycosyltransferase involved in cell wall biosynthesis